MEIERSGDEIELRLPGLLRLRAEFLAEGYYAADPEGDPPEQDLFRIEVTPLGPEAVIEPFSFPLLLPAVPEREELEDEWEEPLLWLERYLRALAGALRTAPAQAWEAVCEASRAWGPAELGEVN
jgi:hypothetical protein